MLTSVMYLLAKCFDLDSDWLAIYLPHFHYVVFRKLHNAFNILYKLIFTYYLVVPHVNTDVDVEHRMV